MTVLLLLSFAEVLMPTVDVLVCSAIATRFRNNQVGIEPPLSKPVKLTQGLYLAGIEPEVAHTVVHACKFREIEKTEDSALYAFVRENPPGKKWDEDQLISKALYLSHFVHPHLAGFEFAARIETNEKGKVIELKQAEISTPFARAYCSVGIARPWLTQDDGEQLGKLIAAYDAVKPSLKHTRVGVAVSLFSESPFIYQGRARITLLATLLEGLVNRGSIKSTKQFTERVPFLAKQVGLDQFDKKWADRVYKFRSLLAHGLPIFSRPDDQGGESKQVEFDTLIREMDDLIRKVVSRALLDDEFRKTIEDIDSVLPVFDGGCPNCRAKDENLSAVGCPTCGKQWLNPLVDQL